MENKPTWNNQDKIVEALRNLTYTIEHSSFVDGSILIDMSRAVREIAPSPDEYKRYEPGKEVSLKLELNVTYTPKSFIAEE